MNDNVYPKLLGSGIGGLLESTIFHLLDTTSKRLMSNQNKLIILIIKDPDNNSSIKIL